MKENPNGNQDNDNGCNSPGWGFGQRSPFILLHTEMGFFSSLISRRIYIYIYIFVGRKAQIICKAESSSSQFYGGMIKKSRCGIFAECWDESCWSSFINGTNCPSIIQEYNRGSIKIWRAWIGHRFGIHNCPTLFTICHISLPLSDGIWDFYGLK